MVLSLLLLMFLQLSYLILSPTLAAPPPPPSMVKDGCPDKCGDVTIPYPFGFQRGCYKDEHYMISCNVTGSTNIMKPFYGNGEIAEIAVADGEMRLLQGWVAYNCFNETGQEPRWNTWITLGGKESPYSMSNKSTFTAVGCNAIGLLQGSVGRQFTTGCLSYCRNDKEQVIDSSCSGVGCCQTPIPRGVKRLDLSVNAVIANYTIADYNSCSYAFVGVADKFQFSREDLQYPRFRFIDRVTKTVPMVLDWTIENKSCTQVEKGNSTAYASACRQNSRCVDNFNAGGYFCKCNQGYEGSPYLGQGCQDIDECADPDTNKCQEICINTPGSYNCSCPDGTYGDGRKDGRGCIDRAKEFPVIKVVLGVGLGFMFILLGSSSLYLGLKKRRLVKLREKFFRQNGGLLLQQQISSLEGAAETAKIFTAQELEAATNNFDESRILGKGGFGTVYKGILPNQRIVAIKKSKIIDETQIEQFINEVAILSHVNHRNVVKLLGCCLETEVPLLVYEYVSNGNLFHHIHSEGCMSSISWKSRLRIAAETAGALAYLHSAASIPIFHRDVKSANILIDENYTAKVSDFGASRLVPIDKAQITTLVQGTFGYLDPEYFHTSQLTDKSDVYSFGVVLAELLTGKLPLSFERSEKERNLSTYFVSSIEENRLFEILEPLVVAEGVNEQLISVAMLAERCLKLKRDERPTMKEVAAELEGLRRHEAHPWVGQNSEESESLLSESTHGYYLDRTGYYSLNSDQEMISMAMPR